MATERWGFFNLYVAVEAEFGTLNADPATAYTQLRPVGDLDRSLVERLEPDETAKINVGEIAPIAGPKNESTLGPVRTYATGLDGTASVDSTPATAQPKSEILANLVGTQTLTEGDVVDATSSGVAVITTTNSNLTKDDCIVGIVTPSNGTVFRHVESISGAALTLSLDLPEEPATSAIVYGGAMYDLADDITNTLQMRLLTERSDSNYDVLGMVCDSCSISLDGPNSAPMQEFSFLAADWNDAPAGSPSALTQVAVPSKSLWTGVQVTLWPHGTTTPYSSAYERKARSMSINFERGFAPNWDPGETSGLCGYDTGPGPFVSSVSLTLNIDDAWRDAVGSASEFSMLVQMGNTIGSTEVLFFRRLFLKEYPADASDDFRMVTPITFGLSAEAASPAFVWALM